MFTMTKDEILDLIRANPAGWFATVEGDRPHVRGLSAFRVRDDGPLFQISTPKDLYRQLTTNPNIEVAFSDPTRGIQVRLSGTVRFFEDDQVMDEVLAERSFLQHLVEEQGRDAIKLFVLADAKAYAWTRENNFMPKEYVRL